MSQTDAAPARLDARMAAATWRPQKFSEGGSREIVDPLVEPLWTGLRAVALVDGPTVEIRDLDGDPVDDFSDVIEQLGPAPRLSGSSTDRTTDARRDSVMTAASMIDT